MTSILITGATSGIGKALALHAAASGYQVIACGRNQQALQDLQSQANVQTCQFDICDLDATRSALKSVPFEHLDWVVLNAGNCEYVDVEQFDPELFRRVFDVNFFGAVNCVDAVLPKLVAGSQLAFVDSMARLLPFSRTQAYGSSKAALHYFAKSLEVDLKPKGIRVQTISPGFVETPLTDKNDFEMPAKISAEQAAEAILEGLEEQHSSVYFPSMFGWTLRFLNLLPAPLQRSISRSLRNQQ